MPAANPWQGHPFEHWSPSNLAHKLGITVDIRQHGRGNSAPCLVTAAGRAHYANAMRAWRILSRLAVWKRIDPADVPTDAPRALRNGVPQ